MRQIENPHVGPQVGVQVLFVVGKQPIAQTRVRLRNKQLPDAQRKWLLEQGRELGATPQYYDRGKVVQVT